MSAAAGSGVAGKTQHGMALVAVLWITAALSLMLTGMTASVRQEVKAASSVRQFVEGRAQAEAAIAIVLQQMAAQPAAITQSTVVAVAYRGANVQVQVMPMNGLIDVKSASPELLQALFVVAGGMPPGPAAAAAQAVLQWRTRPGSTGQPLGLEVPEDLMLVPGFPYDVYARIAPLIGAGQSSSGTVNPLSAPEGVLLVLAKGNAATAARIAAARSAGQIGIDLTQLEASFIGGATSRASRLTASVPLPDGASMRFAHSITFQASAQSELPWRILQSSGAVSVTPGTTDRS